MKRQIRRKEERMRGEHKEISDVRRRCGKQKIHEKRGEKTRG